jgi:hypothetical protein
MLAATEKNTLVAKLTLHNKNLRHELRELRQELAEARREAAQFRRLWGRAQNLSQLAGEILQDTLRHRDELSMKFQSARVALCAAVAPAAVKNES